MARCGDRHAQQAAHSHLFVLPHALFKQIFPGACAMLHCRILRCSHARRAVPQIMPCVLSLPGRWHFGRYLCLLLHWKEPQRAVPVLLHSLSGAAFSRHFCLLFSFGAGADGCCGSRHALLLFAFDVIMLPGDFALTSVYLRRPHIKTTALHGEKANTRAPPNAIKTTTTHRH